MKFIFWDIDGVANAHGHIGTGRVDPAKMAMINWTMHELNKHELVYSVISSAWRNDFVNAASFCRGTGFNEATLHENWRTPTYGQWAARTRHKEIADYLTANAPEAEWLTFDDTRFDFPVANFINTEGNVGIQWKNVDDALQRWDYGRTHRTIHRLVPVAQR